MESENQGFPNLSYQKGVWGRASPPCDCDFIPSMPVGSIRAFELCPFPYISPGDDLPSGWEEFISERDQPQNQSAFFNRLMKDLIKEKKMKLKQKQIEKELQQEKIELERLQEMKRKFHDAQMKKWADDERKAEEEERRQEAEEEARRQAEEEEQSEVISPRRTRSKSRQQEEEEERQAKEHEKMASKLKKNKAPEEIPFVRERADLTPFRKRFFKLTELWEDTQKIDSGRIRKAAKEPLKKDIINLAESLGIIGASGQPFKSVKRAWEELNSILQTDIEFKG